MTKINKVVKKLWIKALRSGEYKQDTGSLKTSSNGFCCLGVLTDIYCKNYYLNDEYIHNMDELLNNEDVQYCCYLPKQMMESKYHIDEETQTKLAKFNDDRKHSFNWIASYIERYL